MSQIMKGNRIWGHIRISCYVPGHEGTYRTWDMKDMRGEGISWEVPRGPNMGKHTSWDILRYFGMSQVMKELWGMTLEGYVWRADVPDHDGT